jgi:hypothetical protein
MCVQKAKRLCVWQKQQAAPTELKNLGLCLMLQTGRPSGAEEAVVILQVIGCLLYFKRLRL